MKPREKDIYRLWWEYLKLSEPYKMCCNSEDFRKHMENIEIFRGGRGSLDTLSEYHEAVKASSLEIELEITYKTFGDVHHSTFEDFWEREGKHLAELIPPAVLEYSDYADLFEELLKIKAKGEIDNIKDFYRYLSLSHYEIRHLMVVCVDLQQLTGKIEKDFKELLTARLNDPQIKEARRTNNWLVCKNILPTPNLRYDEVKRYLKVVQTFKIEGLRGIAAFKKLYPKEKITFSNYRLLYLDRQRGEKIIRNVEKGYFPGYYEKSSYKINDLPNVKGKNLNLIFHER